MPMTITYWGVRGTIPTPGPQTVRYGGNTACVSVQIGKKVLVLDAGTGIRALGEHLYGTDQDIFILLSHLHADHLQGFPFFGPIWEENRRICLLTYTQDEKTGSLIDMLDGIRFPVQQNHIPSQCESINGDVIGFLSEHGFDITQYPVNHPGGAYGFRIRHRGKTFVHIPDNELYPPEKEDMPKHPMQYFVDLCTGADVLSHDAQLLRKDLPYKHGWGHSRIRHVLDLAIAAKVKHLVLFHHDPERTDDALDEIQVTAREILAADGIQCTVAHEGLTLTL